MADSNGNVMNGSVDPESLYTKQNCIGAATREAVLVKATSLTQTQVAGALEKYIKGMFVAFCGRISHAHASP